MEFRILGPLEVVADDRRLKLGRGRQRSLLALLLVRANEVVSSDRLIDELWGESPPPTAAKALQNLVSQLRVTLALGDSNGVLLTEGPGYQLHVEPEAIDARRFEQLAAEGRRMLPADPRRASDVLREALALWRGEALADVAFEPFAAAEIARLEELRLAALEDRIDAELALGRHAALVPELQALVTTEPLREPLRAKLMLALYRSGRQSDALDVYRDGRRTMVENLGLEPGSELQGLQRAILTQDPSLQAGSDSRPAARQRRWQGPHRLILRALLALGAAATLGALALARDAPPTPTVVPDAIVRIDPRTNTVADVLPGCRSPQKIVPAAPFVIVSCQTDDTVLRIDTRTGAMRSIGGFDEPTTLAADATGSLWVTTATDEVARLDKSSLLEYRRLRLPNGSAPWFGAVGAGSLWLSERDGDAVSRYDLRTLEVQRRYRFAPGTFPLEIAFGNRAAWVSLGNAGELARIDADTGRTTRTRIGAVPSDAAFGFHSAWVADWSRNVVVRVDALSGDVAAVVPVGTGPFGVAAGADSVWVTNNGDGTISRIDPRSNRVVATIEVGHFPVWLAEAGDALWVGISDHRFITTG